MALNKQYCIYGVDTSAFYFEEEKRLNSKIYLANQHKKRLKEILLEENLDKTVKFCIEDNYKRVSAQIAELKCKFSDMLLCNLKRKRTLNEYKLSQKNWIATFDSELTRSLGMMPLNLDIKQTSDSVIANEEMIVVSTFYFEVLENIIKNGFICKGHRYVYFASSAGQIRTKKAVFVREDLLNKAWNKLTCGLTIEEVNSKGGMNINKFNAYLALCNSATDVWRDFDIDRCIVVDDFETSITGQVDYVDDTDYSITRKTMPVSIPHTDGAGMISPELSDKNFMVRLPWLKGLLGVFDFKRFIKEKGCSSKITDIYGDEYDIFEDNIQVIFTASQLKMHNYFEDWHDYKERFKKYKCHAGKCNEEENYFKKAHINYQMIQSFIDYSDSDVKKMCRDSVKFLKSLCTDIDSQMELFGISEKKSYEKYSSTQKCLLECRGLLKDSYFREQLKELSVKLINDLYSAKFRVNGYYTFILPDFYAFCERLFMSIDTPTGLLKQKEVHCKLHEFERKVDCLRSPHLYFEHSIQNNVTNSELERWFTTKACYTSTHDMISKELMFDVDGDKTLIIQDDNIIEVAQKNQVGIVPLYYNMRKAEKEIVTSESRYKGLTTAFTGGNIGIYSNNISKIKNSEEIRNERTQEEAINCIRWLCMQNNEVIDYAKTLYKSTPPKKVKQIIAEYTNRKLPYFFRYAKDKTVNQVEKSNNSIVNRIEQLYPRDNFKLKFKSRLPFDYRMLMNNINIEVDEKVLQGYSDIVSNLKIKTDHTVAATADIILQMQQYGYTQTEICDMLVKDMFKEKTVFRDRRFKTFLFCTYGDIILSNIRKNKSENVCVDCGKYIEKEHRDQCRCRKCQKEYRRKVVKLAVNKNRKNKNVNKQKSRKKPEIQPKINC